MKNTIPLILAVLLGLAAVFAVNRTIARNGRADEGTESVVVATEKLEAGSRLTTTACGTADIPESAFLPGRHIRASSIPRIEGLPVSRTIETGSYILWDNLDTGIGGQQVGKGEFMVAISFADSPLADRLKPLDEIAIAAMQTLTITNRVSMDANEESDISLVPSLSILFPRVKVLDVSDGTVSVSAPPEKALQLQMASLSFPLYPLLRRTGDDSYDTVGIGGRVTARDLENLAAQP